MGMAADPAPGAADRLQRVEEGSPPRRSSLPCPQTAAKCCCCTTARASARNRWPTCSGSSDAAVRKRLSRARALVRDGLLQRW